MIESQPIISSELLSSLVLPSLLEVVVIDSISDCIHFPSEREIVSVEGSGLEVTERKDHSNHCDTHIDADLQILVRITYLSGFL